MQDNNKSQHAFQSREIHEDETIVIVDAGKTETAAIEEHKQRQQKQPVAEEAAATILPPQQHQATTKIFLIVLCVAMLALGYWLGTLGIFKTKQTINAPMLNTPANIAPQIPTANNRLFTGIPVSVVIDNSPDSYPQRGLKQATVIWEALTEGDITRYLAVFTHELPEIVGPIRSTRTYFNAIANQYEGLFLHVGGNDMALEEITNGGFSFTDVNEFYHGSTFYRDKKRKAPHNVFTTKQQLEQFIQSNNVATTTIELFPTSADSLPDGARTQSVSIPYFQTLTDTLEWNGTAWIKKRNGVIWKDETGSPLSFNNVVLLSVQDETGFHKTIPELRRYLVDLGGESLLLRDGVSIPGTWLFSGNRIAIRDERGLPIGFNDGSTLAILVPKSIFSVIVKH